MQFSNSTNFGIYKLPISRQRSFGGGMPWNSIPIVIRAAQQTTIRDEETTAKNILNVSHLSNDQFGTVSRAQFKRLA
jgi:hypothetical protein